MCFSPFSLFQCCLESLSEDPDATGRCRQFYEHSSYEILQQMVMETMFPIISNKNALVNEYRFYPRQLVARMWLEAPEALRLTFTRAVASYGQNKNLSPLSKAPILSPCEKNDSYRRGLQLFSNLHRQQIRNSFRDRFSTKEKGGITSCKRRFDVSKELECHWKNMSLEERKPYESIATVSLKIFGNTTKSDV